MGLFTYTIAAAGFILIGAWESLVSASVSLTRAPPSPQQSPPTNPTAKTTPFSSTITFVSISTLSFLFILNSLISLSDALTTKDHVGSALQLEVIGIALLFFLYSLLGLFTHVPNASIHLPSSMLNMLALFAFGEEFWFFYQQRKDPSGIENRYYDLFLVPIFICVFSTCLELRNPKFKHARLGRGVGLVLQGMWILQMGFSFFSDLIAHGCYLSAKSRGNYTVKCKGHLEYHRGRAIATLQFNCHLALLVVLIAVVYSFVCKKHGIGCEFMRYKPLGAEMEQFVNQRQFTLDSDEEVDDENGVNGERNVEMQKTVLMFPESGVNESRANGYGPYQ